MINQSELVVICFHFTIFVVLETTRRTRQRGSEALWFAFILLSLSYLKQRAACSGLQGDSCDLLSFYYLCRTWNNMEQFTKNVQAVVICFHFTIFVVLETTTAASPVRWRRLWFAFILLSLSYLKQRPAKDTTDLPVVICFHFTIFVVLETTRTTWPVPPA